MSLTDLIARVEKASGPDRHLDWEVHCLNGMEGVGMYGPHPTFTASLDAVVALVERELPGWGWLVATRDDDYSASVWAPGYRFDPLGSGHGKTAALALLRAFLRAKQAQNPLASREPKPALPQQAVDAPTGPVSGRRS